MADANSAFSLAHVPLFQRMDAFELLMIEQPLHHDDIVDHAILQAQINTPVCLDESIHSPNHARWAIELNACRVINMKVARVGGLANAIEIHRLAVEAGIQMWCGGMLETCIGRFYNIAIASLPQYIHPADMAPFWVFYQEDVVEHPFTLEDGLVKVPESLSDFGVSEKLIEKYTVKKDVIKCN